jgi:Raf kinase inhibitor-like YbhB/YbcL family protein
MIPRKYTCQGEDVNPPLFIEEVPANAKSIALIVDDPDAPAGTWTHWAVKDIPVTRLNIVEDSMPGMEVRNSWGKSEWGGPCPPSGVHRYFFRVYALDVPTLSAFDEKSLRAEIVKHKVGETILMGRYGKV